MELELNSLDWNANELEHELDREDMKRTMEVEEEVEYFRENYKFLPLIRSYKK